MSFRQRLGLFLTVTLVLVQGLTAFSAYLYLRADLLARARNELSSAMGVFTRQLDFLSERVADNVHVLSLDFALRTAIARSDLGTEISALRNHGQRIGATRMMIAGLDGRIHADTGETATGSRFPYLSLLRTAAANGDGAGVVSEGGQVFWAVAVPVRAPIPIAYIVAFIPIHDGLLRKMQSISSTHQGIALLTRAGGKGWRIAAATNPGRTVSAVPANPSVPASSLLTVRGQEFLTYFSPLDVSPGSAPVAAMLQYSLDDALAVYRGIALPMLAVLVLGLLAMLAGAALIARSVSRPLESLAAAARRIAVGDYRPIPHGARTDEIGDLADALAKMSSSIADREEGLKQAVDASERAKDDALRASRAKSDFLSNMSHELRTPLNAIIGFSEMIGTEALGPVGVPKYAGYAKDIHGAGAHLLGLVERMLTLAEADTDRLALAHESFAGTGPLKSAIDDMRPFAAKSRVELTADLPARAPDLVGEPEKLREALSNILHNAIRFTPAGGTVCVTVRVDAREVIFEVRDTGIGIEPDKLAAVTQPFQRLRAAFDGTYQGAGLGLPYAKVIVERHGGTLGIASRPGEGTTVTIVLPVVASLQEEAA